MIKRKLSMIALMAFAVLGLTAAFMQADFIQCITLVNCGYSDNPDIINGSLGDDTIGGFGGADVIFGNDGNDSVVGEDGNDIIFGGKGADTVWGFAGDDILLAGPDLPGLGQILGDVEGNDTFNVFAGEVSACLIIYDDGDSGDVANLIGFGPYTAVAPFGMTGFDVGWVHVVDPLAGGDIYISVSELDNMGVETINGLPTPMVTILPDNPTDEEVNDCISSPPRGASPVEFPQPSNNP
jgi:hypothetical protein